MFGNEYLYVIYIQYLIFYAASVWHELQNSINVKALLFFRRPWRILVAVLHNPWFKMECITVINAVACTTPFFCFNVLYVP